MREISSDLLIKEARGQPISKLQALRIDCKGIERLREGGVIEQCSSLTTLLLRNNHLTSISSLVSSLWRVDLSNNYLSDVGALAHLPALGWLNLSDNDLTFQSLSPIREKHILCLVLQGNRKLRKDRTLLEYRSKVISLLTTIWVLDDIFITECERSETTLSNSVKNSSEILIKVSNVGNSTGWQMPTDFGEYQSDFLNLSLSEPTQPIWIHDFRLKHLFRIYLRQVAHDSRHLKLLGDPDADPTSIFPEVDIEAIQKLPFSCNESLEFKSGQITKSNELNQSDICALLVVVSMFHVPSLLFEKCLNSIVKAPLVVGTENDKVNSKLSATVIRNLSRLPSYAMVCVANVLCVDALKRLNDGDTMYESAICLWTALDITLRIGEFGIDAPDSSLQRPFFSTKTENMTNTNALRLVSRTGLSLLARTPEFAPYAKGVSDLGTGLDRLRGSINPLGSLLLAAGMTVNQAVIDAATSFHREENRKRIASRRLEHDNTVIRSEELTVRGKSPEKYAANPSDSSRVSTRQDRVDRYNRFLYLRQAKFKLDETGKNVAQDGKLPTIGDWIELGFRKSSELTPCQVFSKISGLREEFIVVEPFVGMKFPPFNGIPLVKRNECVWVIEGRVGVWRHRLAATFHIKRHEKINAQIVTDELGFDDKTSLVFECKSPNYRDQYQKRFQKHSRHQELTRGKQEQYAKHLQNEKKRQIGKDFFGIYNINRRDNNFNNKKKKEEKPESTRLPIFITDEVTTTEQSDPIFPESPFESCSDSLSLPRKVSSRNSLESEESSNGVKYFDIGRYTPKVQKYGGLVFDLFSKHTIDSSTSSKRNRFSQQNYYEKTMQMRERLNTPSPFMASARSMPSLLQESQNESRVHTQKRQPLFPCFSEMRQKQQQMRSIASVSASIAALPEMHVGLRPLTRDVHKKKKKQVNDVLTWNIKKPKVWNPSIKNLPYS